MLFPTMCKNYCGPNRNLSTWLKIATRLEPCNRHLELTSPTKNIKFSGLKTLHFGKKIEVFEQIVRARQNHLRNLRESVWELKKCFRFYSRLCFCFHFKVQKRTGLRSSELVAVFRNQPWLVRFLEDPDWPVLGRLQDVQLKTIKTAINTRESCHL